MRRILNDPLAGMSPRQRRDRLRRSQTVPAAPLATPPTDPATGPAVQSPAAPSEALEFVDKPKALMVKRLFDIIQSCYERKSVEEFHRTLDEVKETLQAINPELKCKYDLYAVAGSTYGIEILTVVKIMREVPVIASVLENELADLLRAKEAYACARAVIRTVDPHLYNTVQMEDKAKVEIIAKLELLLMKVVGGRL